MISIVKDGQKAGFTYRNGEGDSMQESFVDVSTSEQMEESKWRLVVGSSVVSHCMGSLSKRKLRVSKIHIFEVTYSPTDASTVESVNCRVTVCDRSNAQSDRMMIMRGHKSGVLIVFRVASGEGNARTREFILTVNNNEVLVGDLVDGKLISESATMVQEGCNVLLNQRNFHRLFSQKNINDPVVVDSDCVDESLDLYLYRKSISAEEFKKIVEYATDKMHDKIQLHPLGDAWRIVKDAKTMAALFLFHELRYHNIMPLYRQPLDDENASPAELKKPTYAKLQQVMPRRHYNLAVKVNTPGKALSEISSPDGKTTRNEMEVEVGDETGTLKLVLSGDDMLESLQVGSCLVLKNCGVEVKSMAGNQSSVRLRVGSWGKVLKGQEIPEDISFDFEVKPDSDLSLRKNTAQTTANNNRNRQRQRRSPGRALVNA